jgi:hypothetical protein
MEAAFSDEQLRAAIEALLDPQRFQAAERRVAAAAPQLQRVLIAALSEGGWFESAHLEHLGKLAAIEDPDERLSQLRTLLADEARIGMMVGVAVGWQLAAELGIPNLPAPAPDNHDGGD